MAKKIVSIAKKVMDKSGTGSGKMTAALAKGREIAKRAKAAKAAPATKIVTPKGGVVKAAKKVASAGFGVPSPRKKSKRDDSYTS